MSQHMKTLLTFVLIALLLTTAACTRGGSQNTFDVVVLNGRVMDPESSLSLLKSKARVWLDSNQPAE